jgi:hypothetical protein
MRKQKRPAHTRTVASSTPRPRARRSFEGVIAGYLHDISQRHRDAIVIVQGDRPARAHG